MTEAGILRSAFQMFNFSCLSEREIAADWVIQQEHDGGEIAAELLGAAIRHNYCTHGPILIINNQYHETISCDRTGTVIGGSNKYRSGMGNGVGYGHGGGHYSGDGDGFDGNGIGYGTECGHYYDPGKEFGLGFGVGSGASIGHSHGHGYGSGNRYNDGSTFIPTSISTISTGVVRIGKYVICHSKNTGIYFGCLAQQNETEVLLLNASVFRKCNKVSTLLDLATKGKCDNLFSDQVSHLMITDACSIVACTQVAIDNLSHRD